MKGELNANASKILNILRKEAKRVLREPDEDTIHDVAMDAYIRLTELVDEGKVENLYGMAKKLAAFQAMQHDRTTYNRARLLRERGDELTFLSGEADDPADIYDALDTYKSLKYLGRASRDTAERLVEGETYQEIAEANGITIGQVYNRVTKLKKDIANGTEDRTTDSNYHSRRNRRVPVDNKA